MINNETQLKYTKQAIENFKKTLDDLESLSTSMSAEFRIVQRKAIQTTIKDLENQVDEYHKREAAIPEDVADFVEKFIVENCEPDLRDMVSRSRLVGNVRRAMYAAAKRFRKESVNINFSEQLAKFSEIDSNITRLDGQSLDTNRRLQSAERNIEDLKNGLIISSPMTDRERLAGIEKALRFVRRELIKIAVADIRAREAELRAIEKILSQLKKFK